jgi:hypothetical protein
LQPVLDGRLNYEFRAFKTVDELGTWREIRSQNGTPAKSFFSPIFHNVENQTSTPHQARHCWGYNL